MKQAKMPLTFHKIANYLQGHQVRGLVWPKDPRVEKFEGIDLELIEGSLTEYEDVEKVTDGVDVIYHLGAAFQGGGPFKDNDYFEINLRGTFHMLKAAQQRNIKQFIFASTDATLRQISPLKEWTNPFEKTQCPENRAVGTPYPNPSEKKCATDTGAPTNCPSPSCAFASSSARVKSSTSANFT